MRTDEEVRAISANAWFSLGRHGVALHFEKKAGRPSEALVLARGARGKKWEVSIDGKAVGRFSRMEEAVQAVDYEIERAGRASAASARQGAPWRAAPAPEVVVRALRAQVPPSRWADALQLAVWERIVKR